MPPQGSSRKLRPQEQHALMQKYQISIDGPIRRRDWPRKYAPIFGLVRDMERIQYDEYCSRDFLGDTARVLQVSHMCNRVERLVAQAHILRASVDNEETWRLKTEHLILERFEVETDCHVCRQRRWISDFQAMPSCAVSAAKLQGIRNGRQLCQCPEIVRAKLLVQKRILAHHRPDRVFGLGRTAELEPLLAANPNTMATVIGDDVDLCFPFLVLEAKSEKNTVGFESIERQTVFPIRAMLGLQRALHAASTIQSDPLRIIDLWHGCILRHDSALQLLLLIDLICDWARDIFTEQVINRLREQAGPEFRGTFSQSNVQELPSISPASSSSPSTPLQESAQTGSYHEPAQLADNTPEPAIKPEPEHDVVMDVMPHTSHEATSMREASAPSRSIPPEHSDVWSELMAVRSAKDVQLRFRSLSLPESADELHQFLIAIDRTPNVVHTAIRLLNLFNPSDPFITEPYLIDRIARVWGNPTHPLRPRDMPLVYASLQWRAEFASADWVLTKEFACITASKAAIAALTRISKISAGKLFPKRGIKPTKQAPRLIHPLRHLPLPELVHAAAKDQFLYLQVSDGYATSAGWVEDFAKDTFSSTLWAARDSQPDCSFRGCTENICSTVTGSSHFTKPMHYGELLPALEAPKVGKHVIKPTYCVFGFDSLDADRPARIGSAIRAFLDERPCVQGGFGYFYGSNFPITALDRDALAGLAALS
ncbi:hypothetical protein BJX76DRAFT_366250 [Aspergillus varians]